MGCLPIRWGGVFLRLFRLKGLSPTTAAAVSGSDLQRSCPGYSLSTCNSVKKGDCGGTLFDVRPPVTGTLVLETARSAATEYRSGVMESGEKIGNRYVVS